MYAFIEVRIGTLLLDKLEARSFLQRPSRSLLMHGFHRDML